MGLLFVGWCSSWSIYPAQPVGTVTILAYLVLLLCIVCIYGYIIPLKNIRDIGYKHLLEYQYLNCYHRFSSTSPIEFSLVPTLCWGYMSALTACIGAEQWQHALVLWETLEAGDRVLVLPMCYLGLCKTNTKTRKSDVFTRKTDGYYTQFI